MSVQSLLHQIQIKLKVPKNQKNKFGNYNYRSCEDILEGIKKVLPNDCFVSLSDEIISLDGRFYVKATASFHTPEGVIEVAGWAREEDVKKGMSDSQITGAASSYARKYALNGLFAIDDTKDSDFTNKHEDVIPSVEAQKEESGDKTPMKNKDQSKKICADVLEAVNAAIENPDPSHTDIAIRVINDARDKINLIMSYEVNKIKKAIKDLEEAKGITV